MFGKKDKEKDIVSEKEINKDKELASASDKAVDKPYETTVLQDLIYLFAKIGIIIAIVFILFTFMYGVFRCSDVYMKPAIQDGDLVFYYRLDKDYIAGDVIVYKLENGHITTGRVMAVAGDTVDIDDEGILVNGSYQTETDINEKTNRFEGGIDFPLTVGEGQVFILGDKRTQATDSRIIGCIDNSATGGKVMGLFRRRNF